MTKQTVRPEVLPVIGSFVLPYLGSRMYLHGTTLFDLMRRYATGADDITFKIPTVLKTNRVELDWQDVTKRSPRQSPQLAFRNQTGERRTIIARPVSPAEPVQREKYDEYIVTEQLEWDGRSIVLTNDPGFTLVQTLVPMKKTLLDRISAAPVGAGQWLFVHLELVRIPSIFLPLRLEQKAVLANGLLVRSRIWADEEEVGSIDFAWASTLSEA